MNKIKLGKQAEKLKDLDFLLESYSHEIIQGVWTVSADDLEPPVSYAGSLADAKACAMGHRSKKGWAKIELGDRLVWAL